MLKIFELIQNKIVKRLQKENTIIDDTFFEVHIFWEGHKILQNLHPRYVLGSNGQI